MKHIADFRFDVAFMGIVGVDLFDNSVATYTVEDGLTKSTVMDTAPSEEIAEKIKEYNIGWI